MPQVRRESNFGEYAEEAVIIEEQPKVKKENPHFLEANTMEAVSYTHLDVYKRQYITCYATHHLQPKVKD